MGIDVSNPDQPEEEDPTAAWPQWFESSLYVLVLIVSFLIVAALGAGVVWLWHRA